MAGYVLGHGNFGLVYTGIGALCWLPDIRRWAQVVGALLRPGGRLFLREGTRCCGRWRPRARMASSQAAAPLLQTSTLISGGGSAWSAHTDEALRAQGETSAQGARAFARFVLPQLGDLAARLEQPGARMLDVGTGVAALAVAYAETFPRLHVLGLDVLDRALELAQQTIAASDAADRVHVRRQDVAEFTDDDGFDLAWFPAPFIPDQAWRAGLPKVAAALRPGGWLIVGHGKFSGAPLDDAINRFKTVAFGGTPLNDAEAQQALGRQGLSDVRTLPTPPGAPALTVGRR